MLSRSRRRDPRATDYGLYTLACDGVVVLATTDLDEAATYLGTGRTS